MEISAVIASIKGAIGLAGSINELAKKTANVELKLKLAELLNELADTQIKVAELKTDYLALQEANRALKAKQTAEKPRSGECGYQFGDDPTYYCVACFETNAKKIPTSEFFTGTQFVQYAVRSMDGCR